MIIFSRKKWIFDPDEEPSEILRTVEDFLSMRVDSDYERLFANRSAAEFVYSSNLMEKTLPSGASAHDTFACLETVYEKSQDTKEPTVLWTCDGGRTREEMRAQMVQHCRALSLASAWGRNKEHKLTAENVCHLHKTLMLGAVDESGLPLKAGEIRTCGAFTVGHVYPEASMAGLEQAVDRYHLSLERKDHFLVSAAVLFYEFIQVHPFQDGNGRLCRLLLHYALERVGFPFAVPLSSGYSKAMRSAQSRDTGALEPAKLLADLVCLILKSCHSRIVNFRANIARTPRFISLSAESQ